MTGTISEFRREILRVEWEVKDFLSLQPKSLGIYHISPKFRFSDAWWILVIYPYGKEKYEDGIGLYLGHDDSSSSSTVLFTTAVKMTDGSLDSKRSLVYEFRGKMRRGRPCIMLRSNLMLKKDEYFLKDALTFSCLIKKVPSVEVMDDLSLDLKKLQASSAQSDVTVKVKSREYRAHRAVLAARSDVLASALTHDMLEKETGIIRIEDCDADSFQEFLQHLYTGRADINEDNVFHLFRTADKYLVDELKSHCLAFLMDNMTVDNVCDAIALAYDHNERSLKDFCKDFFSDDAGSILETSGWASLLKSHCEAATELLKFIAPKLKRPQLRKPQIKQSIEVYHLE